MPEPAAGIMAAVFIIYGVWLKFTLVSFLLNDYGHHIEKTQLKAVNSIFYNLGIEGTAEQLFIRTASASA